MDDAAAGPQGNANARRFDFARVKRVSVAGWTPKILQEVLYSSMLASVMMVSSTASGLPWTAESGHRMTHMEASEILATRTLNASLEAAMSTPGTDRTCFGAQGGSGDMPDRIRAATVMLIAMDAKGRAHGQGTGFVVQDSAEPGAGPNRILTAQHVAAASGDSGLIVFSSKGAQIGYANVVAESSPRANSGVLGDVSVLEVSRFSPGAETDYRGILGLALDPRQPEAVFIGLSQKPVGAVAGFSGGPLVDDEGRVRGILVKGTKGSELDMISVKALNTLTLSVNADDSTGFIPTDTEDFPLKSEGIAVSVPAELWPSLGRASSDLGHGSPQESFHALVPGFVSGYCAISQGEFRAYPTNSAAPSGPRR